MFASKKSILSNLNHICLQHVSLGVHLSLRPEMQEGPITRAPSDTEEQAVGCQHCQEEVSGTLEVDANSNNTSVQCRCCKSHPHQVLKRGIPNEQTVLEELELEHRQEVSSPSDPALSTLSASSSISSSSDFTLEETPVSFYCREFLSDGIPSPEAQPDIVPLEDSLINTNWPLNEQDSFKHTSEDRLSDVSHVQPERPCSLTVKEQKDFSHNCLSTDVHRDLLEPPNILRNAKNEAELDPNSNIMTILQDLGKPAFITNSEKLDISFNKTAQPIPIRETDTFNKSSRPEPACPALSKEVDKTPLEDLFDRAFASQPLGERALPVVLQQITEGQLVDSKKNITSFHELAQQRRRGATVPPLQPAKKDKSDWLITFSPDTELPPVNELNSSVLYQRDQRYTALPPEQVKSAEQNQKEVTTFKELRFRSTLNKQGPPPSKCQGSMEPSRQRNPQDQCDTKRTGRPEQSMITPLGSDNFGCSLPHAKRPPLSHLEAPARRRISRQGLQPIAESQFGGAEMHWEGSPLENAVTAPECRSVAPTNDSWSRGKADGGDRHSKEVSSFFSRCQRPQTLQFLPLLLRFPAGDQPAAYNSDRTASSPNVEFKPSVMVARPFHSQLKALSCNEVCLLGRNLAYLSPEELLPIRLSPVGAYSPPYRGVLPLMENPGLAVLLSPLFPRSRTFPSMTLPSHQAPELPPARERACGPGREMSLETQAGSEAESGGNGLCHQVPWVTPGSERRWSNIQCLLVAISSSVDKVISHFSTTRNIVQKALLGDSRLSPEVGHLILNTLCPALYALVGNGLKPFQKDVIAGRRRASPWTVVEASVKPGPATRSLHGLYCKICQLPQLSSSQKKFNAFIFGLLNTKLLDFWVSHLQENSDALSVLYMPGGFLSLAEGSFQPHFDELLLLLQPLSILTFHLDLLFEHHHLQVNLRILQQTAATTPCQSHGSVPQAGLKQASGLINLEEASVQGAESSQKKDNKDLFGNPPVKEVPRAAVELDREPLRPASNPTLIHKQCPNVENGGPLQHTLKQVLQWGGKLTQTLVGSEDCPGSYMKSPKRETCTKASTEKSETDKDIKATTWWGQLSQASQVYSTPNREGFHFTKWAKLRMSVTDNCQTMPTNQLGKKSEGVPNVAKRSGEPLSTHNNDQSNRHERESDDLEELPKSTADNSRVHERNGSHKPAGGNGCLRPACSSLDLPTKGKDGLEHQRGKELQDEGNRELRPNESPNQETSVTQESSFPGSPGSQESSDYDTPVTQELSNQIVEGSSKQNDDWNGVPSLQGMLERKNIKPITEKSDANGNHGTLVVVRPGLTSQPTGADSPSSAKGVWLGHLFGAPCSSSRLSPADKETNGAKSRRPSSWLPPNMSILDFVRKVVPPEKPAPLQEASKEPGDAPKPLRTVRAICDHESSSGSHLSFQKDEVLQLLSTVDDDWIHCCRGNTTGLVPVAYTSLIL
ncbi:AP-4 complex accessory subunit RUSC1 isoform X1 [Ambystoma mexicanum]|uniref:AP-4 complex accessory subunit RUSC1 isoform X1 n=1 Tax=Ambystoma mexicanum TaxID=8296 RepID=UPI0037E7F5ED